MGGRRHLEHIRGLGPYRNLGAYLRKTRLDQNLPATEISAVLGIQDCTWTRYERVVDGCQRIDFCSFLIVAKRLGLENLTVKELLDIVEL